MGIPFALQTRVTVCMVLGKGVVGICVWSPLLFVFGGGGGGCVGKSSGSSCLRLWKGTVSLRCFGFIIRIYHDARSPERQIIFLCS